MMLIIEFLIMEDTIQNSSLNVMLNYILHLSCSFQNFNFRYL